ncbi:acyl-CoA dehydrogenase family protein [Paraburkholderia sp. GAS32]|uniref:acyl-CoA dehydrogenase family protein n=1 Tax=Paraburkholderia sp. GAS32 TaxID=3035129 RepID=UPI003D1F2BE2
MNFDFSEEALAIGEEARRSLARHGSLSGARRVLDGLSPYDEDLWRLVAELGWTGVSIAEEHGGSGLSGEVLCMLAYELGRANAAIPFSSSVYVATMIVSTYGSAEQKRRLLPDLGAGKLIGTFAFAEGFEASCTGPFTAEVLDGLLSGTKWPVPDATYADFVIVAARDGADDDAFGLYLVELAAPGVERQRLVTIDPTRDQARVQFNGAHAEPLGSMRMSPGDMRVLMARAGVPLAFELLGGAQACLDMAVEYAKSRYAFGRPIGSFQAIKHKLADMYIAVELARSNAYFAAWALAGDPSKLTVAAASALVCASDAFQLSAKENIQTHGGFGVTWEADCHLYLRRAKMLVALNGPSGDWKEHIVSELVRRPDLITG